MSFTIVKWIENPVVNIHTRESTFVSWKPVTVQTGFVQLVYSILWYGQSISPYSALSAWRQRRASGSSRRPGLQSWRSPCRTVRPCKGQQGPRGRSRLFWLELYHQPRIEIFYSTDDWFKFWDSSFRYTQQREISKTVKERGFKF